MAVYADYKFTFPVAYRSAVYVGLCQQSNNLNNTEYTNSVWPKEVTSTYITICNGAYANTYYWVITLGV